MLWRSLLRNEVISKAINTDQIQNGFWRGEALWGCGTWSVSLCCSVCCSGSGRKVKVCKQSVWIFVCFLKSFQSVHLLYLNDIVFSITYGNFYHVFLLFLLNCHQVVNTQALLILTCVVEGMTVQFHSNGGQQGGGVPVCFYRKQRCVCMHPDVLFLFKDNCR